MLARGHSIMENDELPSNIPLMMWYMSSRGSHSISAALRLGIFEYLYESPSATISDIAEHFDYSPRGVDMLLVALAAMNLVIADRHWQYSLTQVSEAYLVRSAKMYFGHLIEFDVDHCVTPADIIQAVKVDKSALDDHRSEAFWEDDYERSKQFTLAMLSQSLIPSKCMAETFDFSNYSKLLDIGGGSGIYCLNVLKEHSHMEATLLDIPPACEAAREIRDERAPEVTDRYTILEADMFKKEDYPEEFDVAILSQIIHDWSPEIGTEILTNIYESLPKGGTVLVSEKYLNSTRDGPANVAFIGIDMLHWLNTGQQYSVSEVYEMLISAGFDETTFTYLETRDTWGYIAAMKL